MIDARVEAARQAAVTAALPTAPPTPSVLVVGAGIGGLVTALLLASRGLRVQVLEMAGAPGGKMRQLQVGATQPAAHADAASAAAPAGAADNARGASVDSGPTVLTMRWVFERIFEQAGTSLDQHVVLSPLQLLARHAWGADERHDRLDLHADRARSVDAIGRFAGAAEARRFECFCREAQAVYRSLEGPYIRSPKPSVAGMIAALGPRGLAQLVALGPLTSLASLLGRRFHNPRLRQLFGRYATYCGASPYNAPATLMLVAQVEMDGVWSVQGGLHGLACALAALAAARGVEFSYGTRVDEIVVSGGRARGVRLSGGRVIDADHVVFNGDTDALAQGLLGDAARAAVRPRARADRSLSALTCSVLARAEGFPLVRHNVFFDDGADAAAEFDDVFAHRRLPRRGTVYVCAQNRNDASDHDATRAAGPEPLLLLINAPPDGDRGALEPEEIERCERNHLAMLARCGLRIQRNPAAWTRTTPQDFARLYPGSGGGLYGTATNGWMSLFKRPGSTSRLPGLWLCGGSVHPGPGVPMAAMSGLLAAEALMAHLDSTSRSRRAAISGGTSTPSATTAVMR